MISHTSIITKTKKLTRAYHDGQGSRVHQGSEEHTQDSNKHRPHLDGVSKRDDKDANDGDKGDLSQEDEDDTEPVGAMGVDDEEKDVGELDGHARAVDGQD